MKPINNEAIKNRNKKHNFLYYYPFEIKLSSYARLLKQLNNTNEYVKFQTELDDIQNKIDELSIEDFSDYFDEFLYKYNLK